MVLTLLLITEVVLRASKRIKSSLKTLADVTKIRVIIPNED